MNRKFLTILCLVAFFTIGFQGCDSEDFAALRGVERIQILDQETRQVLHDPASTGSDSIALIIYNEMVFFSSAFGEPDGMMTSAWATSPPEPIMANEITDIRVFCDQEIYQVPVGDNLASVVQFGSSNPIRFHLEDFLKALTRKGQLYHGGLDQIFIYLDDKPVPGTYNFIVEIEDNNGHIFTSAAPSLEWL